MKKTIMVNSLALITFTLLSALSASTALASRTLTIECQGDGPAEGSNADEGSYMHLKIKNLIISPSAGYITLEYTSKILGGGPIPAGSVDEYGYSRELMTRIYRIDNALTDNGRNMSGDVKVSKISGIEIDVDGKDKTGSDAGRISIPRYGNYKEPNAKKDNYGGGVILEFGAYSLKGILNCEQFEEPATISNSNR